MQQRDNSARPDARPNPARHPSDRVIRAESHSGGDRMVGRERRRLDQVRVFLGLGNPGDKYASTYHNVGVYSVELFAACAGAPLPFRKPRGATALAGADRAPYHFLRSLAYMNESGGAAREALARFSLAPAAIAVVHDDADLPIGTVRAVFGRGAAGHHGIISVISALGTAAFWRIRIGVRPIPEMALPHGQRGRRLAGEFVLNRMRRADRTAIDAALRTLPLPFMQKTIQNSKS